MHWLSSLLQRFPELSVFAAMALGFVLGELRVRALRLGGVAGTLLTALLIAQLGVRVDDSLKAVFLPLFAYALGFEVAPQFVLAFRRSARRELWLALFMTVAGLLTALALARIFGLDKGLAAGVAAGGLTQAAIVGTAEEALTSLGLPAERLAQSRADLALGYALASVFGVCGVGFVCLRLSARARRDQSRSTPGASQPAQALAADLNVELPTLPELFGRSYVIAQGAGQTPAALERAASGLASIERVERAGARVPLGAELVLAAGDRVMIAGRREGVLRLGALLGPEDPDAADPGLPIVSEQVVFRAPGYEHKSLAEPRPLLHDQTRHGARLGSVVRKEQSWALSSQTELEHGDVLELHGTERGVKRLAKRADQILDSGVKTDIVYLSAGALVGVGLGLLRIDYPGVSVSLGGGAGALLSGLTFGWLRAQRPVVGVLPPAACALLRDLGLAGSLAVIGVNSGEAAYQAIDEHGLLVFSLAALSAFLPLLLSLAFAHYVLRYQAVSVLAGSLSGAYRSTWALAEIVQATDGRGPADSFAITYAVTSVTLTLLGPIIVALV